MGATTAKGCLSLTELFTAMFYIPSPEDIGLMFALNVLKSLAYAPTVPLLWAMLGDVADHVEYQNHRATGFCFSGVVFALKAGLGLGGAPRPTTKPCKANLHSDDKKTNKQT